MSIADYRKVGKWGGEHNATAMIVGGGQHLESRIGIGCETGATQAKNVGNPSRNVWAVLQEDC